MKTDNPEKSELNLATLFSDYADEDRARELLESLRWPNGAVCPHCAADKPYKLTAKADSKSPVRVALIERGGEVRTKIVDRISHKNIGSFMRDNIAKGSTVNTDANPRYKGVYLPAIKHEAVNHSQKEFIREKPDGSKVHVNHCESFFSLLKRGVYGSWHHVSKEHLPKYANEFAFRWNTRGQTDGERMETAIGMVTGKRLIVFAIGVLIEFFGDLITMLP